VGVVDDRRVATIDVGEVITRAAVPRHVDVAWAEREPAHRAAAGDAHAEAAAADKGDQGRGVDRAHVARSGDPAPAAADVGPASVMEGREAPGGVVDPGPAPRIDPRPVTVAV